jgi:hypothetical protein
VSTAEQAAAGRTATAIDADRNPKAFIIKLLLEAHHASRSEIATKQGSHDVGMIVDDMQRAVLDSVTQRNHAAHPHPLLL